MARLLVTPITRWTPPTWPRPRVLLPEPVINLSNNPTGALNGTNVNTSDTTQGDHWDVATPGTGGTLQWDAGSILVATGVTSTTSYVAWNTQLGTVRALWFRAYVTIPAAPPTVTQMVARGMAGATQKFRLTIESTGKLFLRDQAGTQAAVSTSNIPAAKIRVEGFVAAGSAGAFEIRYWTSPDSAGTPTETLTGTGDFLAGDFDEIRFGVGAGFANVAGYHLGGFNANTIGFPGPLAVASTGTGAAPLLSTSTVGRPPAGSTLVISSQSDPPAAPTGAPPAPLLVPAGRVPTMSGSVLVSQPDIEDVPPRGTSPLIVPGPRPPVAGTSLVVASRVDLSAPTDPQPASLVVAGRPQAPVGAALVVASRADAPAVVGSPPAPVLSSPVRPARPAPPPLVVASRVDISAPTDTPPRPTAVTGTVLARPGSATVLGSRADVPPVTDSQPVPIQVGGVRRTGPGTSLVVSSQAPSPDAQPAPLTTFPSPTVRLAGTAMVIASRADVPPGTDSPTAATVVSGVRRTGPGSAAVVSSVAPSPDAQPAPVVRSAGIAPTRTGMALVTRIVADQPAAYPGGFTISGPGRWPARAGMSVVSGSLPPPVVLPATLAPVTVLASMPRYRMAAPPVLVHSFSDFVMCETPRPSTGTTARPGSGTTAYALATTARPSSGTTTRPNTGQTDPPCG